MHLFGDTFSTPRIASLGGVSRESVYSFRASGDLPTFVPLVASLVLHSHARGFRRTSLCLPFCIQLPHHLCCESGSFASCCLELCGIPKYLFTLASPERTSRSRPSFSGHRL